MTHVDGPAVGQVVGCGYEGCARREYCRPWERRIVVTQINDFNGDGLHRGFVVKCSPRSWFLGLFRRSRVCVLHDDDLLGV